MPEDKITQEAEAVKFLPDVDFTIHGPMISGQHDAVIRKYHLYTGKSGKRWLVADQEYASENIYVEGGPNSDGFGGATLKFPLVNGDELSLKGPWKAGVDSLYTDTGVDLRDRVPTRGLVALEVEHRPWPQPSKYSKVIHMDDAPVMGAFDRIEKIAQEYANKHQVNVYKAYISKGGGCAGMVKFKKAEA